MNDETVAVVRVARGRGGYVNGFIKELEALEEEFPHLLNLEVARDASLLAERCDLLIVTGHGYPALDEEGEARTDRWCLSGRTNPVLTSEDFPEKFQADLIVLDCCYIGGERSGLWLDRLQPGTVVAEGDTTPGKEDPDVVDPKQYKQLIEVLRSCLGSTAALGGLRAAWKSAVEAGTVTYRLHEA